jgi:hypothetical protein
MPRPKSFSKTVQEEFLDHLRNGMMRGAAAEAVGLQRKTVLDYIATHEAFEKDVLDAEGEAYEHVEEALYQAAISGNVSAAKMWLDHRRQQARGAGADDLGAFNQEASELLELAGN